ncbi:hypothetical protein [Demequina gelatinilytica]|uniref:hypothetical protein n=1 Tax=Demequina gelatinilytica TaxID=1638980 RepID=UPI0007847D0C|nr:hypothetical protein [Demequina gelatinilytica]
MTTQPTTPDPTDDAVDMGARPTPAPEPDFPHREAHLSQVATRDRAPMTMEGILARAGEALPTTLRQRAQHQVDLAQSRMRQDEADAAIRARAHQVRSGLSRFGSTDGLAHDRKESRRTRKRTRSTLKETREHLRRAGRLTDPDPGRSAAFVRTASRWGALALAPLEWFVLNESFSVALRSEDWREPAVLAAVTTFVTVGAGHVLGRELKVVEHPEASRGRRGAAIAAGVAGVVILMLCGSVATARVLAAQHQLATASAGTTLSGMGGDQSSAASGVLPGGLMAMLYAAIMIAPPALAAYAEWRSRAEEEAAVLAAKAADMAAATTQREVRTQQQAIIETQKHLDAEPARIRRSHRRYRRKVLPAQSNLQGRTYAVELARIADEDLRDALELRDFEVAPAPAEADAARTPLHPVDDPTEDRRAG